MRRTVVCPECKIPFVVEGLLGLEVEAPRAASCPYPGCCGSIKVSWPIDSTFKAVPIYKPHPAEIRQQPQT